MRITDLRIYPVKSMAGQSVEEAVVEPWGLLGDRRWALVDEAGEADLLGLLRALRAEGTGAILVTHRPALIAAADTLLVLRDGVVDRFGARAEVLSALQAPPVRLLRAVR